MLPRFFQVKYMPPSAIDWFHRYVFLHGRGMGRSFASFLLLPFNLTYHTANFNGAGGIGLAPLALAPLGVLALRRNPFAAGLALLALFSTVAWFLTAQESRYLIPVYGIAVVFAVAGWKYAATMAPRFGPALSGLVVACSVLYGLFMVGSARAEDLHAVVSPSYAETRAMEEIPFRDSFRYLNHDPGVTEILVLAPLFPAYYFDKNYVKPIGAVGEESLPDAGNIQAVLAEAPSLSVSHVLDVRWKGAAFEVPDHQAGLTLIFENADQRIYRVNR